MPDEKLSFRFRRRRTHKHAFEPKSRFHFFRWTVSTNRYAFGFWGPIGPARAAILPGSLPDVQGFLALQESQKIFRLPIFGFPETSEKGGLRLILHFWDFQRPQRQGRRCWQTKLICATDCPDDCRHFHVFHVTIKIS